MDTRLNKIVLISLNVNGIKNKIKRHKILLYLKSLNCDIAMLQETHLNVTEAKKLRQNWVGQLFSSPGGKASRGVSILISKNMPFKSSSVHVDQEGRYIIVSGWLQNEKVTLVNVYAPNILQSKFFASLCPTIARSTEGPLIIGGDFNSVCDPILDRSSQPLPSDKNISTALREFQSELGITDIWRLVHPDVREYSFYSGAHNSYSRIDYIMMSSNLIQNVLEIKMNSILVSDHAAVSVTFFPPTNPCKSKQWRLNTMLLKNENCTLPIKDKIIIIINLYSVSSIATVWEAFKATCRGCLISFSSGE